ncbi:transglutaminase domain-containing protein [Candidatus Micrarchaeota archaeon]|nr:transglutaminase domain-containing protein [Candidatus Micrarchaeota archaeon]
MKLASAPPISMKPPVILIILAIFTFGCCSLPPLTEKCDDGTLYGYCSETQPKFCEDGQLIDEASLCGCPPGDIISEDNSCAPYVYRCYDGTPYNECSQTQPKYCSDGMLEDNAPACGCPEGKEMRGDNCVLPPANFSFLIYEDAEPYYRTYCDKIDPYDLSVREAASDAIRNHSGAYSVTQLFDIYDWVKQNVIYQNVPLAGIPYPPEETLATESGDCKNQAVLLASMVEAIGGTARVVVDPDCAHAYTMVHFGPAGSDMSGFTDAVFSHYGPDARVSYITYGNGTWMIFDPAGGTYPGSTLPECTGNRRVYFVSSCLDCSHQYLDKPHTYNGLCYSECPSGTISVTDYSCTPCSEGSGSCKNQCWTCPKNTYLGTDCMCHYSN